jgi:hypothetical protein
MSADPTRWTRTAKVVHGGDWYPQVVGLEPGTRTDKQAGETVRFFMWGASGHLMTLGY